MCSNHDPEDIRKAYEATVNYRSTLVQMRFAVASFFAAAAAFLVGATFSEAGWLPNKKVISLLGFTVTCIIWMLEIRTYCLLKNLEKIGLEYEKKLKLGDALGFFWLMSMDKLPIGINIPFINWDLQNWKFLRKLFTHSAGLSLFYLCFIVFWAYSIIVAN